jgi:hypothetical protein
MKKILILFSFLIGALFMYQCKEKVELPSPTDPCLALEPVTANFLIKEAVGDSLVETDRVLMFNSVQFEAIGAYDSYEWQVGTDERTFTDKKFSLRFMDDATGSTVPVRLIVKGKPNSTCFPSDNGIDTIHQKLSGYTFPGSTHRWPLRRFFWQ